MSQFAKRSLGQNFLHDLTIIGRIVAQVDPRPGETIVEVGPGRGALTDLLVRSGAKIIAVELDDDLSESLRQKFAGQGNFSLLTADILEVDLCALVGPGVKARIVANLPYNISTTILQQFIEQAACISDMILMLQREVVDRITAGPNASARGFLSVLVEAHCAAEKLFDVPPASFKPAPKVWSSVVRLTPKNSLAPDIDRKLLWRLVGAGFGQRRKTILNNLKASPHILREQTGAELARNVLEESGIDGGRRAQTLTLPEWVDLARATQRLTSDKS